MSTNTTQQLHIRHHRMDCKSIAQALGMRSPYTVRMVKVANAALAKAGREGLIFSGRTSTPAKVSAWLDTHQDFVARRAQAWAAEKTKLI